MISYLKLAQLFGDGSSYAGLSGSIGISTAQSASTRTGPAFTSANGGTTSILGTTATNSSRSTAGTSTTSGSASNAATRDSHGFSSSFWTTDQTGTSSQTASGSSVTNFISSSYSATTSTSATTTFPQSVTTTVSSFSYERIISNPTTTTTISGSIGYVGTVLTVLAFSTVSTSQTTSTDGTLYSTSYYTTTVSSASTNDSLGIGFVHWYDTVFWFKNNQLGLVEVIWSPTITIGSTEGFLTSYCASNTTDFTQAGAFSSYSAQVLTSSTTFTSQSFSATSFPGTTFSYYVTDSPQTATSIVQTTRQHFLGSNTIPVSTITYTSGYNTSSASIDPKTFVNTHTDSIFIDGMGWVTTTVTDNIRTRTFTTIYGSNTTVSETIFTTFGNNQLVDDFDNLIPIGSRTTTVPIYSSTFVTLTSWAELYPAYSTFDSRVTFNGGFTAWVQTVASLVPESVTNNTYYQPTNAQGFVAFGTAGEAQNLYRSIDYQIDPKLGNITVDISPIEKLAARDGVSGIIFNSVASTLPATGGNAKLSFSSRSDFSPNAITLDCAISSGTSRLTGTICIFLNSASAANGMTGHTSTGAQIVFGGMQSVTEKKVTARFTSGHRSVTSNMSNGNSSTTTSSFSSYQTSSIDSSVVVFHSAGPYNTASCVNSTDGGGSSLFPLYQTTGSDTALPQPSAF